MLAVGVGNELQAALGAEEGRVANLFLDLAWVGLGSGLLGRLLHGVAGLLLRIALGWVALGHLLLRVHRLLRIAALHLLLGVHGLLRIALHLLWWIHRLLLRVALHLLRRIAWLHHAWLLHHDWLCSRLHHLRLTHHLRLAHHLLLLGNLLLWLCAASWLPGTLEMNLASSFTLVGNRPPLVDPSWHAH